MNEKNPQMRKSSYCLDKTRKKLLSLWLAVLFLFFGTACAIYGWTLLLEDKSAWTYMEYIKLVVGWGGTLGLLGLGLHMTYTSLRDALFPAKSTLARSIRSQLPYPDSAPEIHELFGMVDRDIEANGQWFDHVAVGKEWVLGDMASYIPRIRVFFGRDEIRTRTSGERVNTSRIIELYILDDRRQTQITTLRNPRELQPLLDCISLRAPDALCRPYSEYSSWRRKSDTEWENMLREYRVKQGEREMESFQNRNKDDVADQNMILTCPDGSVTSRVTPESIRQMLTQCLEQGEGTFSLAPGQPILQNNIRFIQLECFAAFYEDTENPSWQELTEFGEAELTMKMTSGETGKTVQFARVLQTDIQTAEQILYTWFQGTLPDFTNWEAAPLSMEPEPPAERAVLPPHLGLLSSSGVFQSHDRFTLEDVDVAAQGLEDKSYQMVDLTLPGGYLWMRIQGGDKTDGRCKISVTRADSDKLRYFRNISTHRQAASWLREFAEGTFHPDWKEWKDYTRQAAKESKKK